MKKIYLHILILISLLFVSACSNKNEIPTIVEEPVQLAEIEEPILISKVAMCYDDSFEYNYSGWYANKWEQYGDSFVSIKYSIMERDNYEVIDKICNHIKNPEIKSLIIDISPEQNELLYKIIREIRPDIMLIMVYNRVAFLSKEYKEVFEQYADLTLGLDFLSLGETAPKQALALGMKTLVFWDMQIKDVVIYQTYPLNVREKLKAIMSQESKDLGLDFIVWPLVPRAHNDFTTDISRAIDEYGNDIAFFSTEQGAIYWMFNTFIEHSGIVALPELPGYRFIDSALNLGTDASIAAGDYRYANEMVAEKAAEMNISGRFANWPVSVYMLSLEAALRYASAYIEGRENLKNIDIDFLQQCFNEAMAEFNYRDTNVYLNTYEEYGKNAIFISEDYIVY